MAEFKNIYLNNDIMLRFVQYFLGSNGKDYYKLIHNKDRTIMIMPFNILGALNKPANIIKPKIVVPRMELPVQIIGLALQKNSKNTAILTMNSGWSISFRIHNAKKEIEPSLKFDIQLESRPKGLFYINKGW
jgi:hypothetical protein